MSLLYKCSRVLQNILRPRRVLENNIYPVLNQKYTNVELRFFCDKSGSCDRSTNESDGPNNNSNKLTQASLSTKFDIFCESDAPILLDVYEEKMLLENEALYKPVHDEEKSEFAGLNLERGVQGVFDIEDLIDLLRRDRAEDIFVASLPPHTNYVDYIVVVTGRSRKHMAALVDIVRRVFKKKRLSSDIIPRIEGENSNEWMALDLGNIALHIFSPDARTAYDLESLWSVGPEYDPLVNAPEDSLVSLLKKHEISFADAKLELVSPLPLNLEVMGPMAQRGFQTMGVARVKNDPGPVAETGSAAWWTMQPNR